MMAPQADKGSHCNHSLLGLSFALSDALSIVMVIFESSQKSVPLYNVVHCTTPLLITRQVRGSHVEKGMVA